MKTLGIVLVLMLAIVSLLAAGCGDGDEEASPTSGPTVTLGPGETPGPTATPGPGKPEPVHFNDLIAFLPGAPSGWEADTPGGASFTVWDHSY